MLSDISEGLVVIRFQICIFDILNTAFFMTGIAIVML